MMRYVDQPTAQTSFEGGAQITHSKLLADATVIDAITGFVTEGARRGSGHWLSESDLMQDLAYGQA